MSDGSEDRSGELLPQVPLDETGQAEIADHRLQPVRFAHSALWVLAAGVVSTGSLSAVAVLTARLLGPDGRGRLVLMLTVTMLITLATGMGINIGARIHLVSQNQRVAVGDFYGLACLMSIVGGLVAAIVGTALLPLAGVTVGGIEALLMGIYGTSILAALFARDTFVAFGLNKNSALLDAVGSVALLAAILAVFAGDRGTNLVFAMFITSGAVQMGIAVPMMRSTGILAKPNLNWPAWKLLMKTGSPGVALNLGMVLTYRLDRYLVGLFLTPAAVGVYSVAASASELLRLPSYAMTQVAFHRLAAGVWTHDRLPKLRFYTIGITGVAGLALVAAAPPIVRILFGDEFSPAVDPLRILVLGELAIAILYVEQTVLAATVSTSRAAVPSLVGLFAIVIADIVMIPRLGIAGAAGASVLAYALMAGAAVILVVKARKPSTGGEIAH